MKVRCPECRAVLSLAQAELSRAGRMLRCARCGTRWLARDYADDPYAARDVVPFSPGEISDAVVIEDAPAPLPSARRVEPALPPPAAARRTATRGLPFFAAAIAVVLALGIFHAPIVAALPLGNLPGDVDSLAFRQVRSETVELGGRRMLVVEGEVANRSGAMVELPAIRITLKAPSGGAVRSWLVEPTATTVEAGRTVGFRSRLADPPEGATQVTLNLAAREGKGIVPLE